GGDLGQHVDAVGVLVDHPVHATHLALDAAQPTEQSLFVRTVAVRAMVLVHAAKGTPARYSAATPIVRFRHFCSICSVYPPWGYVASCARPHWPSRPPLWWARSARPGTRVQRRSAPIGNWPVTGTSSRPSSSSTT